MPKLHRTNVMPPGTGIAVRNTRLYGSHDEQIAGYAERARGCPNPDNAVVYRRRPRSTYRDINAPAVVIPDCTPREHQEHVRIAQHNFDVLTAQVKAARERGDEPERQRLAALARERRATLLALTGGTERREIEVDLGSAVNPMVAV